MKSISARFLDEFLKENVVVFDGGICREATAKTKIQGTGWYCLRIDGGALEICTPPSKDMGLMYCDVHDNQPRFVLLPRIDALKINKNGTKLCSAMTNISKKGSLGTWG